MEWLHNLWLRISGTRLALLEAENERLRETNAVLEEENAALRKDVRALENTVLGQAGVAPLPPAEEVRPVPRTRHLTVRQQRRREELLQDLRGIEAAKNLRKPAAGRTN